MIYKELSFSDFYDEFQAVRPNNFSYDGLKTLYEYYDDLYMDTELDVIAICCDWTEYQSDEELMTDYGHLIDGDDIEDLLNELDNHTYQITIADENYLVMNF